jgi:hypothetical protein
MPKKPAPEAPEMKLIHDVGEGLKLYLAPLDVLREQDVNARLMPAKDHAQMVNNMRKAGHMESVPYCILRKGVIEVVSGHHRIRAAREAGILEAPILLDESELSRSEVVAKQLAHNKLVGYDDDDTLGVLFRMLDTPDDILESGFADEITEDRDVSLDPLLTPHLDMDWKSVTFTFLPHQFRNLEMLIDMIPPSDMVAAGAFEQYDPFMKAAVGYGRLKNIRSAAMAVAILIEQATKALADSDAAMAQRDALVAEGWTPVVDVLHAQAVPPDVATVVGMAMDKMVERGELTEKNRWQALEYWAADYLASPDGYGKKGEQK